MKMKWSNPLWLVLTFVLSFTMSNVFSQKTLIYTQEDAGFRSAYELFEKQKFGSAQKQFRQVIEAHDAKSIVRVEAEYYSAICGIELFNKDAELLLKNFISEHPESPHVKTAYFHLGKYNYRKKKFEEAKDWFAKVDVYDLTKEELPEFYFKRGYSSFEMQQMENAKKDFFEIKDVDTKYTSPANYYYSHIAYTEKNYETALGGFLKLTKNETFGPIVPYYIAQIYYLQGRYNEVISYAPSLLDSSNTKRGPEIARIIGEAYFKTARYKEALPFLKRFEKSVSTLSREDSYELGFAYYESKDYDNATTYLQGAVSMEAADLLTENAYYHLGDCYVRKNKKQYALSAFYSASKIAFDKQIQEDALFSYAKLCYELSYNPYNEAVNAFKKYIADYPRSPRVDEAFSYLTTVYLTTKNYKEALVSIESIRVLSPQMKPVYQRIAYNRGVEFYNNMQMDSSIKLFDKALIYSMDKTISCMSHYWKAEAQYRLKQYDKAIDNYKAFVFEPGAFNLPEFTLSNYNLGYAYFKKKDYASAIQSFRKFTSSKMKEEPRKLNDAFNRIGDSYFMTKDFSNAVDYYDQAIKIKLLDVDYALYQKALALGVQRKNDLKISTMLQVLSEYPSSNYAATAKFELAKTYLLLNDNDNALAYYNKVITEHPNSILVGKSMLQTGVVYRNKKEDDQAIGQFKKVVSVYPASSESKEALALLRSMYVEKGDMKSFEDYIKDIPFANFSKSLLDSSAYEAAKNSYFQNNCDKAVAGFSEYLQKYPDGIFAMEANYYRSDCQYRNDHFIDAAEGYKYVVAHAKNKFTEASLMNLAAVYYHEKNYAEANTWYSKLEAMAEYPRSIMEARIGQMRCNYFTKNYPLAIQYAKTVLITEKVPNEVIHESHITIARSAFETENYELAMQEFKTTSVLAKSVLGAEARYYVAYIYFLQGDLAEAKKSIFELVNQEPSYPYWMTKGLILLSDVYLGLKDTFQAKTTLKSVISDSDIPELVAIAENKLKAINDAEAPGVPKLQQEEMKIEFNNKDVNNRLFPEEIKQEEPPKQLEIPKR